MHQAKTSNLKQHVWQCTCIWTIGSTVEDDVPLVQCDHVRLVRLCREKRVLWDQFHSLRYPPGYLPRDSLEVRPHQMPPCCSAMSMRC